MKRGLVACDERNGGHRLTEHTRIPALYEGELVWLRFQEGARAQVKAMEPDEIAAITRTMTAETETT